MHRWCLSIWHSSFFMVNHVSTAVSSSVCLMHRHAICMQCEQNLSGVARSLVVDPWRKSRGGASVAPSPQKTHLQSNRKMEWSHKSSHTTSHGSWNATRIIDHYPFNLIFKATIQKIKNHPGHHLPSASKPQRSTSFPPLPRLLFIDLG